MKFIVLAMTLLGAFANAQEKQQTPVMVPAIERTAVIEGAEYYIKRDENNKLVFIKKQDQENGYAIKPIIVIPTIPENNQK